MKNEFIIYVDGELNDEYNSFISFNEEDRDEVDKFFSQFLEIELLSKKVKCNGNMITYHFKVTKEKEDQVRSIFTGGINQKILNEFPISFN